MPTIANVVLTDDSVDPPVDHTYNPASKVEGQTMFVDRSDDRAANWGKLSASASLPTATTAGKSKSTLTIPVPVTDQTGCCVDKDAPKVIAFNVSTALPSHATDEEADSALAQFRSWVNSDDFASLFSGENFY